MPTDFERGTFETILIRLLSEMQWKLVLTDKDSEGNILYIGRHTRANATPSDTDWYIWKITDNVEQGPLLGSWSDRKELEWNRLYIGPTLTTSIENYRLIDLMEELLVQQKITNAYLSNISEYEEIGEEDVE